MISSKYVGLALAVRPIRITAASSHSYLGSALKLPYECCTAPLPNLTTVDCPPVEKCFPCFWNHKVFIVDVSSLSSVHFRVDGRTRIDKALPALPISLRLNSEMLNRCKVTCALVPANFLFWRHGNCGQL